ncbi:Uncharacterised protein [Helicobacter fennelliae]|uniref:Uncharacterized protein n=2 Tax=Helicobacter TaxID=209 RepID=A0A2X3DJ03_9HELI|nr:hypothetical protein [Helicobacter fennelliae]SQB98260.1 Uncharacterised protein [Helicobacter fennelliae]
MRLFCVLLFVWVKYAFAETYAELQEQILELEIEILENENNPEKLHSVELMKRKVEALKRKQAMFKPTSTTKDSKLTQTQNLEQKEANNINQKEQFDVKHNPKINKNRDGMLIGLSIGGMQTESRDSLYYLKNSFVPIRYETWLLNIF